MQKFLIYKNLEEKFLNKKSILKRVVYDKI